MSSTPDKMPSFRLWLKEGITSPGSGALDTGPASTRAGSVIQEHPSWRFATCDMDPKSPWPFTQKRLSKKMWTDILPALIQFEGRDLSDIFIKSKKLNHTIPVSALNPVAQKRIATHYCEIDKVASFRLEGKKRIYTYQEGAIFNIMIGGSKV